MPRLQVVMPDDEPDNAVQPRAEELRLLEAMLFASAEPLDEKSLAARLPQGTNVREALVRLQEDYATRGVNLLRIGGKWTFRTANDLVLAAEQGNGRDAQALARGDRDACHYRLSSAGHAGGDRGTSAA